MSLTPALRAAAGGAPELSLWRPFGYFNYYRLVVASVFLVAVVWPRSDLSFPVDQRLFQTTAYAYWAVALIFVLTHQRRWLPLNSLLTLQVLVDTLAITLLMHAGGGHRSGLAIMLVVVLAGAGLVGQGRLTLFYAAFATLAVLCEQAYRSVRLSGSAEDFVAAGFLSIGFFATAISARLLAQRVIANQELAVRRGVDLDHQLRVNERIIRDMADGVLVVDRAGVVQQFSPRAETLLGRDLAPDDALADLFPDLGGAFLGFMAGAGPASVLVRPGDPDKPLRARFVKPGDGGAVLVYLEDLGRIQAQAQQIKLAALGRLTGSIAHEIRNPLAAISHAAELLREEKRGETQVRLIRIVTDNARRIERMVKEILELGRRDRTEPEQIALAGFLDTFLDEMCTHERLTRETFDLSVPPDAALVFDRAHINQVLWNLLGNAVKYSSRGPRSVRIAVTCREAANRCELHIMDDGPGIGDDARGRVFEPFFTTHPQGTGLGLYIARELCDANQASLELLENSPGAHFCVTGQARKA